MYEISSLFTHGFKLVDVSIWYKNSVSLRQQNSLPGGWSIHLLLRRRKITVWARIVSVEDNCRNNCNVFRTMSFMLSELSVKRDLNPGHQQAIRCLQCPAWWNGESHSMDLGNRERVELIHLHASEASGVSVKNVKGAMHLWMWLCGLGESPELLMRIQRICV